MLWESVLGWTKRGRWIHLGKHESVRPPANEVSRLIEKFQLSTSSCPACDSTAYLISEHRSFCLPEDFQDLLLWSLRKLNSFHLLLTCTFTSGFVYTKEAIMLGTWALVLIFLSIICNRKLQNAKGFSALLSANLNILLLITTKLFSQCFRRGPKFGTSVKKTDIRQSNPRSL